MALRDLWLFLLVCLLAGLLTFAGSVLGHSMGQPGLFAGAVIGGLAGVALAVWLSTRIGLLSKANFLPALIGGSIFCRISSVSISPPQQFCYQDQS
jgi:hypothetical protein